METYDFQLQDDDQRATLKVTQEELRAAGWFDPAHTELDRWLLLWDLTDKLCVEGA